MPQPRAIALDFGRHARTWHFEDDVRPWFVVVRLGSELMARVNLAPGDGIVESAGKPPHGRIGP